MSDNEERMHVIESPLASWPGSVTLPHPDDFDGNCWRTWRAAVDKPLRKNYSFIHLNCYAGLELVKAHGEWELGDPLEVVQGWETDPDAERVKLVAWLGRVMWEYMQDITDPKG